MHVLLGVNTNRLSLRTTLAASASLLLTLTACGGGDDASSAAEAVSTAPATGGAAITIAGFAFSGATEVAVGTTVAVTNDDSATHTWTSEDGTFDSGSIAPGESFEFTFDTAGTFAYHCNFHASMQGTITVTA